MSKKIRPQSMTRKASSTIKKVTGQAGDKAQTKNPALLLFEDELFAELFNARCHDTGEPANMEKAKLFKDELLKLNQQKNDVLSLNSLRLGINAIISLSNTLPTRTFMVLNVADNSISDYGMHAVKNILLNSKIEHLNLASNMISDVGLEMLVHELTKNSRIKGLDLGVLEGSIRKNSFGVQGAKCVAAILLHNKTLETLKLQDNDLGAIGGELIGAGLSQNRTLKNLKMSENDLKSEGVEHILKNAKYLETLDLGKNYISARTGHLFRKYIESNSNLKKLNLEYNELQVKGIEGLAPALISTHSLRYLNLRGNCIRDEGAKVLADALEENIILEDLDVSLNEITPTGSAYLADIIPRTGIKNFNISKNFLGDEAIKYFAEKVNEFFDICRITKLDFSSSRIGDEGILFFLQELQDYTNLQSVKLTDNFISEKIEKILVELLDENKNLIEFSLQGNRISLSCLSKIKKVLKRNLKMVEDREPNRLKVELYRLQYEQKKIMEAKENMKLQERDITKYQDAKESLLHEIQRYQTNEDFKRQSMNDRILKEREVLKKKQEIFEEKQSELGKIKERHKEDLSYLTKDVETATAKKVELETELTKLTEEKDKLETGYQGTIKELKDQIALLKKKGDDLKKKEESLNEEFRKLKNT
jgi:Ran GTPase-activating protein (RanGAP) involved in mRNA processing and transport